MLCALGQPAHPSLGTSSSVNRWLQVDSTQDSVVPMSHIPSLQLCRRKQLRCQAQAAQWTQSHRGHWLSQRQSIAQCGWQRSAEQEEKDNSCACRHSSFSICQLGGAGCAALSNSPGPTLPFTLSLCRPEPSWNVQQLTSPRELQRLNYSMRLEQLKSPRTNYNSQNTR